MNIIHRSARAVKAASKAVLRFAGGWSTGWSVLFRGSRINYGPITDAINNSAVGACVLWICRTFPEAPVRVLRTTRDGEREALPDHPMLALLERPNEAYSGPLLWMATVMDFQVTGNAYWLKARNSRGGVVQLWYIPASLIEPKWPQDGSEYISHYEYKPGGTTIRYDVQDVVHFRFGIDPNNLRKGLSPLASVLREVFSDDEAANFSGALLRNLGIPGAIIAPDSDQAVLGPSEAELIKAEFKQKFSGDNRGDVMVMPARTKFERVAFSPEEMNLTSLRRLPEERIAAVLGIPPGVVGLGAGLDRNTYSNLEEGRRAAYEGNIIPTQRLLASELKTQLLDDFGNTAGMFIDFDVSEIRALNTDREQRFNEADRAVQGGWWTVRQGKKHIGMTPEAGDEYFLRKLTVVAVPAALAGQPPLPPATATDVPPPQLPPGKSRMQTKAADDDAHATLMARLAEIMTGDLTAEFRAQTADVLATWNTVAEGAGRHNGHGAAVIDTKALRVPGFLSQSWDRRLVDLAGRVFRSVADEAVAIVGGVFGWEAVPEQVDADVQQTVSRLAQNVTSVNETTRKALAEAVQTGIDRGYTHRQIADGVEADGYRGIRGVMTEATESRALLIAKTETAAAFNHAQLDAYGGGGLTHVLVLDGDSDSACSAANGQTWAIADARGSVLEHPRCVRRFVGTVAPESRRTA